MNFNLRVVRSHNKINLHFINWNMHEHWGSGKHKNLFAAIMKYTTSEPPVEDITCRHARCGGRLVPPPTVPSSMEGIVQLMYRSSPSGPAASICVMQLELPTVWAGSWHIQNSHINQQECHAMIYYSDYIDNHQSHAHFFGKLWAQYRN